MHNCTLLARTCPHLQLPRRRSLCSPRGQGSPPRLGMAKGVSLLYLMPIKPHTLTQKQKQDQMHLKLHLPEKMTCFTVSPNGYWAAAGSPNGHIYLWELSSGLLVSSHTAHYRALTYLTFTPDSRLLISTSLDSSVHVYLVSQLIDPEDPSKAGKPYGMLKDHNLAVRCVGLGRVAGSEGGRLWTASDDGTVKVCLLFFPWCIIH